MLPAIVELRRQRFNPEIIAITYRTASTTFINLVIYVITFVRSRRFCFTAFYACASAKFNNSLPMGH